MKLKEENSDDDLIEVEGDHKTLLADGVYIGKCIEVTLGSYYGKPKIILGFETRSNPPVQCEDVVYAYLNFSKKISRSSKLYKWIVVATDGNPPVRRDRFSPKSMFLGKFFRFSTRTSDKKFRNGEPTPAVLHYSVLDELMELIDEKDLSASIEKNRSY
ncbi:MAG: hypothetical protein HZA77_12900 [Candidatus Schekmanbacteria bacterium]|nr:hypothetical protein [Candidatus Schekmanbacteria bacterium]